MSAPPSACIETETTPEGEQTLVPGVRPVTLKERLEARMAAPMAPKRNPNARQKPLDIGLFDKAARNQLDLLDFLRAASGGASSNCKVDKANARPIPELRYDSDS